MGALSWRAAGMDEALSFSRLRHRYCGEEGAAQEGEAGSGIQVAGQEGREEGAKK
jgi:hypothetical protein